MPVGSEDKRPSRLGFDEQHRSVARVYQVLSLSTSCEFYHLVHVKCQTPCPRLASVSECRDFVRCRFVLQRADAFGRHSQRFGCRSKQGSYHFSLSVYFYLFFWVLHVAARAESDKWTCDSVVVRIIEGDVAGAFWCVYRFE